MKAFTALILACLSISSTRGDLIQLKDGGAIRGTIIQETSDLITVAMQYGTMKIDRTEIRSIDKTIVEEPEKAGQAEVQTTVRLPRWSSMIAKLAKSPWATELSQIPATVIDKGVMRNVPYMSYRCGKGADFEVNVYGDPDAPDGVEIGVYGKLLTDAAAKRHCIDFIASVLMDKTDVAILKALNLDEDKVDRGGMTIEITPATAEDAYGGWWVSVYYAERLDKARASEKELQEIAVARIETPKSAAAPGPTVRSQPKADAPSAEPRVNWTSDDIRRSRAPAVGSSSSSGSGRVYVRGYYRKNGTYVRGHTRRR